MNQPVEPKIVVYFWLPRDEKRYEGLAFDQLSSTGIAFVTKRELTLRQKLKISICVVLPGNDEGKCTPPIAAEVTQIDKLAKGWQVFAHFLEDKEASAISGEDRRKQKRYPVILDGDYRTLPAMPPHTCQIQDISKLGACFVTDQGLKIGKTIHLRIFTTEDGLDKIMIDAQVEVRRSQHKGHGVYEIGVRFLHHKSHHEEDDEETEEGSVSGEGSSTDEPKEKSGV